MTQLDVAFLPPPTVEGTAVVIDVLRMTTTAAALFDKDLAKLMIVADRNEAIRSARSSEALLLGERGGMPLEGFHGGNSPLEHVHRDLSGKTAVLCTTNGSKAVEAVAGARHILLGAIVNARATAKRVIELDDDQVVLVCAGTDGRPSLDDVLGAGCIAAEVRAIRPNVEFTDAAELAITSLASGIDQMIWMSRHACTLSALGFADDVEYAAVRDRIDIVPERSVSGSATFFRGKRGRSR